VDPVDVLLQTAIFRDLGRRDVEELLPCLHQLTFARGEAVWSEGEPATALYVVAEGQLKSHRVSRDGGELILEVVSSGDITGQAGLFHPSGVRQVCVSAMEPTVCLTVSRDPLLAFMTRHPPAMLRMLESISELTVRAAYSLTDVAFDDIRRRVARTLLGLANEQGEPSDSGVRIRLKLSQTTLAAMVAASRENVNRALALFISRGNVSQRDGFFFVHDRKALEEEVARSP
jgi:CRP/FNR family cyclic AMP-dependent transcriptional regulator